MALNDVAGLLGEDRFDVRPTGGKEIGSAEESWWRKTSRGFNPTTGSVTSERVFRYDQEAENRWTELKDK